MADHDTHDHTGVPVVGGSVDVATDTIFDAKGDLAVGTGANTAAKLPVGANDTIPMADSAQSTGIKWIGSQTPSTQAFSDAAAEGTADTYARGDHKHAMPASPAGGSLTTVVQELAADFVSSNDNAWHDVTGMTGISLAAGTWIAIANIESHCSASYGPVWRITDGTTTYAQAGLIDNHIATVSQRTTFTSKPIVLGSTTSVKLQTLSDTGYTITKYPVRGGDTSVIATHITFLKIA